MNAAKTTHEKLQYCFQAGETTTTFTLYWDMQEFLFWFPIPSKKNHNYFKNNNCTRSGKKKSWMNKKTKKCSPNVLAVLSQPNDKLKSTARLDKTYGTPLHFTTVATWGYMQHIVLTFQFCYQWDRSEASVNKGSTYSNAY